LLRAGVAASLLAVADDGRCAEQATGAQGCTHPRSAARASGSRRLTDGNNGARKSRGWERQRGMERSAAANGLQRSVVTPISLGFPRSIYMISLDYWAPFIDEPEHKS